MKSVENTNLSRERMIITLIREDLRSNKLLLGLDSLGLNADKYTLAVSDLVFELMGCTEKQIDALMDVYSEIMDQAVIIRDVDDTQVLNEVAKQAYKRLLEAKKVL